MISKRTSWAVTTAILALIAGMSAAGAQTAAVRSPDAVAPAPGADPNAPDILSAPAATDGAEIIVTGSRVARQGFNAPTPTTILSAESLQQRGSANLGQFLNELPAFRSSTGPQTSTQQGGYGQFYADLRGLGNVRTLTLVDGRRHVPSAATGQVDLNLIPTALVDRVEVVTGGASAAYGSDAVSGVVNVILNKRLQGVRADLSLGVSDYGDNFERRLNLAVGTAFAEGRGHIIVGGDIVKSDGVGSFFDRPWGARGDEVVSFPTTRIAGTPSRIYATGTSYDLTPVGGLIIGVNADTNAANGADVLRGIAFGAGGVPYAYNYGNDIYGTGTAYDFTNPQGSLTRLGHALVQPANRQVALGHIDYDVTDSISAFVEAGYARSGAAYNAPLPRDTATTAIVIRRDNAFLPASIAAIMDANRITQFSIGRANPDYGQPFYDNVSQTERVTAGLSGRLGGSWKWDAYYEYGRNVNNYELRNLRIEQNFQFAYDAIRVNGQPTCRALVPGSTTYNPIAAAGCQPLNVFGPNNFTAAAAGYVNGVALQTVKITQQVAAVNLRGTPFNTWAGPVAVAIGGEHRNDTSSSVVDRLSENRAFNFGNPQPFTGKFRTDEGYLEVLVPLAKDLPFARSLDVNGAIRYTEYSYSGGVTTWKGGVTWAPFDGIKFRATASRDIRAPNGNELFASITNQALFRDPFTGQSRSLGVISLASPSLQPEKADTRTAGIILTPGFIPGLNLSADYYDINIKGAISSYPGQQVLDNCFAEYQRGAPGFFCGFVTLSGSGNTLAVSSFSTQLINLAALKTRGIDFEASYRRPVMNGTLTARLFGTYTAHLISDDGLGVGRSYNAAGVLQTKGSVIDRAGQNALTTGQPRLVLNGSLTFANDRFSFSANNRFITRGTIDASLLDPTESDYNTASPISVGNNKVSSRYYLNLATSLNVVADGARRIQFYVNVDNVFNTDPPFPASSMSGLYGRLGRYYRLGVRASY